MLPAALPGSLRRLTLEGRYLEPSWTPIDAPEVGGLEQLVVQSDAMYLTSLNAFERWRPQRLTLQAGSRIEVMSKQAAAVLHAAQELYIKSCNVELCCPTSDCIRMCSMWRSSLPAQQIDEFTEGLRSWWVPMAHMDQS